MRLETRKSYWQLFSFFQTLFVKCYFDSYYQIKKDLSVVEDPEDSEEDIYDDIESNGDPAKEDKKIKLSPFDYDDFTEKYCKMDDNKKWVLTTGTVVEDALYEFGMKCVYEQ